MNIKILKQFIRIAKVFKIDITAHNLLKYKQTIEINKKSQGGIILCSK